MARKGSGRVGSGKFAKRGGSGRASGRGSGRRPASSRRSGRASGRRAPAPSRAGGIQCTCMECYERFSFHPSTTGDVLVCTVCGHAAHRPSEDKLHEIAIARRPEKRSLSAGRMTLLLALASYLGWVGVVANPELATDDLFFYAPLAAGFIFFVMTAVFAWKYEASRHETYF